MIVHQVSSEFVPCVYVRCWSFAVMAVHIVGRDRVPGTNPMLLFLCTDVFHGKCAAFHHRTLTES
jgi:hypothetical protein